MQQRQPEDVNKPLEASASGRQAIPAASLFQADPPARPALAPSSMQVAQQSACLKWPRPPCKPPASCSAVSTAGRDSGNMQTDGPRFDTSTNPLSSSLSRAQTQRHPAQTIPQGNSSGTLGAGTHGAGNLASRLHAMQADAVDRAWQRQHEAERLAHIAVPSLASSSASAAAAPLLLTHKPEPSGPMPVSGTSRHNGTVKQQHCCGMGQQGKSLSSNSRSLAAAITCSKPAVQCAEPSLPTSSQPTVRLHTTCKPAADPQAVSDRHTDLMPENRGADLSTDTESLVAKLRALSQGRSDCAHSKASSKLSGQQQPRRPFACRAADCNQPQPSIADPNALPPSKRSKQAGMQTSVAAAAAGAGQAAAVAPSQPRPNTARCIQLTEPVHSGTEYGSGTSPKRRSRRLQPQGSPTASNRPRSAYASVAAPIQLGAPTEQLPAAALPGPTPAPSVAAAADPSRVHQQAPASPVQHRLGKPTPLKKGFTPKPSRFRLEAERLSITPPDKSSGLEKVLFRSPVKVAAAASRAAVGCSNDNVLSASCFAAAAPQAGVMTMPEIAQQPHAAQAVPGLPDPCSEHLAGHGASQEMVTPANGCISSMQADPPGVFAHMKVILDPELSPEESHRYSQRHKFICSQHPWLQMPQSLPKLP